MWRRLGFLIRRDERRPVAIAFAFLCLLVAAHTALESARDGLFLSKIPGDRLPFVYIGIAVLSFAATKAKALVAFTSRRAELSAWTTFAGAGTLAVGVTLDVFGDAGLYVLYIWAGVVTAMVLVHFWSIMGDVFTATQAKRVYGVVGLGGMIGAVLGSAAVSVTARAVGSRAVVFAAGGVFLLTALLPRALPSRTAAARGGPRPTQEHLDPLLARFRANFGYATRGPYVWRLIGVALAGSITVTLADYLFKATVVEHVASADLTIAFARTYLVLNALSLVVQILAVGVLLRRLSPSTVVAVLPVLLIFSGSALAFTGGLAAAVLTKGVDGTLRHGLHKTGIELLCVPLSEEARRKVKTALELVGQRGGQVLGSSIILAIALFAPGTRVTAMVLVALAVVWAALALRLHGYYVDQFRDSITGGRRGARAEELDVASLETLIATLDSDDTDEVVAALSLLERERKDHLVPGLILFHPKEEVVVAALRIFARRKRNVARYALDHLIDHASPRVRAEAYVARAALAPDSADLQRALARERAPEARAAIISAMTGLGLLDAAEGQRMIAELLEATDAPGRVVVAETIGWGRVAQLSELVVGLARDPDPAVRAAAVHALGSIGGESVAEELVKLLGDEPVQKAARAALARTGAPAFEALLRALHDRERPSPIRWAVPKAIATVHPAQAAPVLLSNLERERDGMVRYRTLVALGGIIERDPRVILDKKRIHAQMSENVARAYRYLDRRLVLRDGARDVPSRKTPGHELLIDLLHDKEKSAVGRIYRLLGLVFPQHHFGAIYRAIENGERPHRAGAVELTAHLLPSPLRQAVVGLVDEIDDDARLGSVGPYHDPIVRDYDALLVRLLSSRSTIVRDVAAYHMSELGQPHHIPALEAVAKSSTSADVEGALAVLRGSDRQLPLVETDHGQEVRRVG